MNAWMRAGGGHEGAVARGQSRRLARVALVLGVAGLLSAGCDQTPARSTLHGWPPGEPVRVGGCEFLLQSASLYHSTEWHLEVELRVANAAAEKAYCGFAARAMTSSDTPLTDTAKAGVELGPDEEVEREAMAREDAETGMSKGRAEDAWVYVELSEGHWPLATSTGVHVNPERTRPPG